MCLSHLIYTVRPCVIQTCHADPWHALTMPFFSRPRHSTAVERRPCCAVALRRTAWSEHGMASVNQKRTHCVNQMGKTHSKPLAARTWQGNGMGTAFYVWIGLRSHLNSTQGTCCNRLLPAQNAGTTPFVHTIRQNRHVTAAGTWP